MATKQKQKKSKKTHLFDGLIIKDNPEMGARKVKSFCILMTQKIWFWYGSDIQGRIKASGGPYALHHAGAQSLC